jgi:hypothetical protein
MEMPRICAGRGGIVGDPPDKDCGLSSQDDRLFDRFLAL